MIRKASYDRLELLKHSFGRLEGQTAARLPAPPFLMFDRITQIADKGGAYDKGLIAAEKDVVYDEWFFLCHFRGDPVMPGCLGVDALWQLCGFYLAWAGLPGQGRALGCGSVKFDGEIRPHNKLVRYDISVRRVLTAPAPVIVADGAVTVDGKQIYECKDLKVGTFQLPYEYP